MAKAYKVTLLILDLNGEMSFVRQIEEIKEQIDCGQVPGFTSIKEIQVAEIGEWHDDHPLNKIGTDWTQYFK